MGKSPNLLCDPGTLIGKMAKEPDDLKHIPEMKAVCYRADPPGSLQKAKVFVKYVEQHVSGADGEDPVFFPNLGERIQF